MEKRIEQKVTEENGEKEERKSSPSRRAGTSQYHGSAVQQTLRDGRDPAVRQGHGFENTADEGIAIRIFMFECRKQFRFPW